MKALLSGYGQGLVSIFFGAVLLWSFFLIILPQLTILESALIKPQRQLDSAVAGRVLDDARTCASILEQSKDDNAPAATGGLAIPSMSALAAPSATDPSAGGPSLNIQCQRTTTRQQLARDQATPPVFLFETYGLPERAVADANMPEAQRAAANEIAELVEAALPRILEAEADAPRYALDNFGQLVAARAIPLSADQRAIEDARLSKQIFGLMGLRFERDGQVYERLGLVTLVRTIYFAALATGLALLLCYPIAFKVALSSKPERAVWLFLGLVIPYAIAELMRIYAWTIIIDNRGLINSIGLGLGLVEEAIQFKRFPATVFVVIVYTYVLFMVFPIVNVMTTLDRNQIEAAKDLGASMWRVHRRIIIPHAKPGIAVGCIATFMLAAGAFSVPRIISRGLQAEWYSQTIYSRFFEGQSANIGAAYSFAYTVICFGIVALFMWLMRTRLKDFARVQ